MTDSPNYLGDTMLKKSVIALAVIVGVGGLAKLVLKFTLDN